VPQNPFTVIARLPVIALLLPGVLSP